MAETNKDLNHPWPKVPRYPDIQKIAREESTPPPAYRERNEIQDALNQVGGPRGKPRAGIVIFMNITKIMNTNYGKTSQITEINVSSSTGF